MSANTERYRESLADWTLKDPGNGCALDHTQSGVYQLTTTAAETRTLARPLKAGLELTLCAKSITTSCTITVTGGYNAAGDTTLVFDADGEMVVLRSCPLTASTFGWRDMGTGLEIDLSSTAAGKGASLIGLEDANGLTSRTNVETAIEDLNHNWLNFGVIQLPLNCWRETSTMNVGNAAANGGVLASDTTPVLSAVNGATAGCQQLAWAATNVDEIAQSVILPADLDDTADIVLKCWIKSAGTTDAVGFSVASYFGPTGTAITDTTATNQTATYAIKSATIATADFASLITAGTAQVMTIGLTPVAHGTDIMYCAGTWLEYTRRMATI